MAEPTATCPSLPTNRRNLEGGCHAKVPCVRVRSRRHLGESAPPGVLHWVRSPVDPGRRRAAGRPPARPVPAQHLVGLCPSCSGAECCRRSGGAMSNGHGGQTGDHRLFSMSGPAVPRFPAQRVCGECATRLSIYNGTAFCSLHEEPGSRFVKPRRLLR